MSTSEKNTADQARHHKRGAHRAWVVIVLVILIAAAAVYFMMRPKTQTAPLPVVEVEKVDVSDVNIYGEYVGRIRAQQFVEVHARVEGYLQKMCFTEGTYVKAGQTLFVIDPQLYQAHVNKARAQLNKAEALARKTKHDLDRIRPLYEQNAASQLDLDNAVAAYEGAQAEVTVSRADLTQADLTLGYTRVTSPISGYISESYADIGTLVGPSGGKSLLATVVKSDTVRVDFSMTAIDYLRGKDRNVSIGSDNSGSKLKSFVTITLADGSEYPVRGQVDFADPKVDPKTGTFSVRAEMPNPDRNLLPGDQGAGAARRARGSHRGAHTLSGDGKERRVYLCGPSGLRGRKTIYRNRPRGGQQHYSGARPGQRREHSGGGIPQTYTQHEGGAGRGQA